MRVLKLLCLILLLTCRYAFAQSWQEASDEHFIVYFIDNDKFAKDVLDKAELYYRDIASELGYPRYSEFWTWDKRVKIYIYPNHDSFLKATGQPQWSEGMADYNAKAIMSYAWSQGFVDSLLPHEMAHLIFRDFVGFKGEIPLWLDEGVAQWAEKPKREHIKALAKQCFDNDSILSLEDMMKLDIRKVTSTDRVYIRSTRTKEGERGVLFLSGDNLVNTYYLQSVSLVGFLIERFGSLSFASFCRELRDGKSLEQAISGAYGDHMRTLAELEDQWREYLSKQ
ncbi:MAG TPA: hypothetical protein VMD04_02940 [Candidatus Margulisiibacteriota bacterium]|nr:hypothetical protein [Candidatus Margulisiibacteriota bacterium]